MTEVHVFSFTVDNSEQVLKFRIVSSSSSRAFSCFWKLATLDRDKSDIIIVDHVKYFVYNAEDYE